MRIAVIGASGAVGSEIIKLLETRNFPVKTLRCFASSRSLGKTVSFRGEKIPLEVLEPIHVDLAFFAAGSSISKEWIPKTQALCIDSSSAFRETAPLIIPEINAHALKNHTNIVASPNCAATILLMPLAPLHKLYKAKRIVVSTYQAASGAGVHLMNHLQEETLAKLQGRSFATALAYPYAFNVFPHPSELDKSGYVGEELKMRHETRKILEDPTIALSATCVRVPVLRAHSVSANVEFHSPFDLEEAIAAVQATAGVLLFEDRAKNRFPTPFDATGRDEIFCGRFRIDPSQPNTLEFWAVGDQLLKGAALNAVQIAETVNSFRES
ncbi:MAG TPA: aspartate-semialdehyde dehydrogenase [Chlamydiales bacterium]|jgi:aspartate-semialdehyde dehydrogenase|nr:aspartate-semialdehyde dehydrogenase [Chlamydiales bacterium]